MLTAENPRSKNEVSKVLKVVNTYRRHHSQESISKLADLEYSSPCQTHQNVNRVQELNLRENEELLFTLTST